MFPHWAAKHVNKTNAKLNSMNENDLSDPNNQRMLGYQNLYGPDAATFND